MRFDVILSQYYKFASPQQLEQQQPEYLTKQMPELRYDTLVLISLVSQLFAVENNWELSQ